MIAWMQVRHGANKILVSRRSGLVSYGARPLFSSKLSYYMKNGLDTLRYLSIDPLSKGYLEALTCIESENTKKSWV